MKTITYNPETHVLVARTATGVMQAAMEALWEAGSYVDLAKREWAAAIAIAAAPQPEPVESEPVIIEEPNYHFEAIGCGLEDRNITDRYEAMHYGWDCAISRMFEQIPDEPLYTTPQPDRTAELEAALKVARDALIEYSNGASGAITKINEVLYD